MRPIGWYLIIGLFSLAIGFGSMMIKGDKSKVIVMPVTNTQAIAEEPKEIPPTSVDSGDGMMKIVMTVKKLNSGDSNYKLKVINNSTKSESNLYETILNSSRELKVPFNSWSPDNKQLFLIEENGNQIDYFVFRSDGSVYSDGRSYLDINAYWEKSNRNSKISDVTGWAGQDLLVVNTTKMDGSSGPAFWFVTSSRSFMQLRQL